MQAAFYDRMQAACISGVAPALLSACWVLFVFLGHVVFNFGTVCEAKLASSRLLSAHWKDDDDDDVRHLLANLANWFKGPICLSVCVSQGGADHNHYT